MHIMESMAANDETLGGDDNQTNTVQPPDGSGGEDTTGAQTPVGTQHQTNTQTEARPREHHGSGHRAHRAHMQASQASNQTPQVAPLKRVRSFYTPYMEDKLLRRLKFFFMGPHEKIKARKRCPWKLIIQVLKIILVTIQLIQFGYSRSSFVEFTEKSTRAMKHMYLLNWNNAYETMPYPPAIGKYAIYTTNEIVDYINYALDNYFATETLAIGNLRFFYESDHPVKFSIIHYNSGNITHNKYSIDDHIKSDAYNISCGNEKCNITQYLYDAYNVTLEDYYETMLKLSLEFKLKLFRLEMTQRTFPPQLFYADVKILLDDSNKDGQMLVTLTTDMREQKIDGKSNNDDVQEAQKIGYIVLDIIVIVIASLSVLLCSRSVYRAQLLRRETNTYFKHRHGRSLKASDQCEFLNLWYVTIIINDILTLIGTGYKIQLESRNLQSSSANYDICSLLLGTGSLLAWLGVLRYVGFFPQFNILIITLKKAFPNMMRFLACCMMLYIGFVICGWVVLGPYHIKFRQMSTASECLFSLINGDDMFVTFSATVTDNQFVWYYSRVYLYLFISLFIYAVLNLFIAVIMDTYETIKDYYENGFPKSELFQFIDQCQDPVHSPIYRREDNSCSILGPLRNMCCCCAPNPDKPNEYTSLIQ